AQTNLSEKFIVYRVNHGHVLVFRINVSSFIGINWRAWVRDKEQMIGLIVVHSIGAIKLVKLDRSFSKRMLINSINNSIGGISDEDLSKIRSSDSTCSLRNVEQLHDLILS